MGAKVCSDRRGFTLIEVMVVLAIIAGIVALVLPRIGNRNNQMKAVVRKMSVLSRELHTRARLNGATYRLVIDMKQGADSADAQTYAVEKSTQKILLNPKEEEILKKELSKAATSGDEISEGSKDGFEPDPKVLKKPVELPGVLKFVSVEKVGFKQPVTTGKVYITYFPQGLGEEAVIHLKAGENLNWTIAIHPLTGEAEVATRFVSLDEVHKVSTEDLDK